MVTLTKRDPNITEWLTYKAHAKQRAFHRAVRLYDYVYFKGGRNSGKTIGGALQSIQEAIIYQPASRGMVVAPTNEMLQDNTMFEFFRWLPRHFISEYLKSRKIVTLTNGTEIAFRSGEEPQSLRGPNRQWAWLDEPRNYKNNETFNVVAASLRPTVKMFLTSTPAGIFHWLYQMFTVNPLPNSYVVKVRTVENPHRGEGYETRMASQYSTLDAAQELDAEDVSFEGLCYPDWSEDAGGNVTDDAEYNPALPVIWGVDDGFAYGQGPGHPSYHPRVVLFAQRTAIGGVNVFDEIVVTGEMSEATIENALKKPYRRPEQIFIDSSAAELKARLYSASMTVLPSTHKVTEGIKNMRRMIASSNGMRLYRVHTRCKHHIREMKMYHSDPNANANSGEVIPAKVDDHTCDAGRYLTWNLRYS